MFAMPPPLSLPAASRNPIKGTHGKTSAAPRVFMLSAPHVEDGKRLARATRCSWFVFRGRQGQSAKQA